MNHLEPYRIRENFSHDHGHELPSLEKFLGVLQAIDRPLHGYFKGNEKKECFSLLRSTNQQSQEVYRVSTSYYIGTHWWVENKLPVTIYPKYDSPEGEVELNYLELLVEALKNTESAEHLENLVDISFNQPSIHVNQKDDLLTPLLVIQYMQLLKRIVRKGLKKSYFRVKHNLRSRVKGKVMVNETIKTNHARQKMLHTICTYDEFGLDHLQNRLLKKAFVFGRRALESLPQVKESKDDSLQESIRYINPAFQKVGDELDLREARHFKPDPLYKEYQEALKLAKLILKRYGYNITKTESRENKMVETPPFWIDMSKLFELYVLQKLKEAFPGKREVTYHKKIKWLEPDYLLKSEGYKMVVDAKYKDYGKKTHSKKVSDLRQVAGYARLNQVYDMLGVDRSNSIDCLIIYADQTCDKELVDKEKLKAVVVEGYNGIFEMPIKLPQIK